MCKRILIISAIFISISFPNIVHAQRSIGKVEKNSKIAKEDILDFPVKQWIGKEFIFLEKPIELQKYGYDLHLSRNFYSLCNPSEFETEITCNLKYRKFVGKIIRAINIEKELSDYIATFIEEESNMKIYAKLYKGCITDIAFLDDMKSAKKRWMGEIIYAKRRSISTYDGKIDKYGELEIEIAEPLKVLDIWWGFSSCWPRLAKKEGPLWVIVETSKGEKGFIPTAFSWTNIYEDRWFEGRPWEDDFSEFNPKERYKWSDEIWELINSGKARVGMNKEQVKLSWGKPEKVSKDIYEGLICEQWIYGSQYLYFENDKLTAIQSH